MSKLVIANCDYICGHLRFGHYELNLTDEEYEEFKSLSEEEQSDWIESEGLLEVDDYEIEFRDKPTNIKVQ